LADRVSLGANLLQTVSLKSFGDAGRRSQLLLVNLGYAVGGDARLDFGYRLSRGGDRFHANAFFMNANLIFDSRP
jgi:hypothetical protein